jgi:hypothetical protein
VTDTFPDAPLAITAGILVADATVNDAAAVPPKFTAVAPVKLVPVRVTTVPVPPLVGVNDVMVGGETKKGLFLMMETVLLLKFATAKSALPSPSKSAMPTE